MNVYFAPLEGITGYVFRNAYEKYYGGVNRYFTPFITPHTKKNMDARERRDILPENNMGIHLIPQVLTNKAEELISISKELREYGYEEINLNIGCPSKTVTAKGKGAAFLENPKELDRFFDEYFSGSDVKLSIKTRLGMEDLSETEPLFEVFERYPFTEVIVHARLGRELYGGIPHRDVFEKLATASRHRLVYNGDIRSKEELQALHQGWNFCDSYMLGRGLVAKPGMLLENADAMEELDRFEQFHNTLLAGYREYLSGDRDVLFKLKELWSYWIWQFPGEEKLFKQIKKCNNLTEYKIIVDTLLKKRRIAYAIY
jgi:tRNA-dihydrouridine synthase